MGKPRRVVIGIDARIIGGEYLHFVEAVFNRVELGLIAQMPFAGEIGRVTVLLEELGDCRRRFRQAVGVTRNHHDRESRADRIAAGHEGSATRSATRLTIPAGEHGTLGGDPVNVRCRMAEVLRPAIAAEVAPAGVVGHENHDVWFLVFRLGRSNRAEKRPCSRQQ